MRGWTATLLTGTALVAIPISASLLWTTAARADGGAGGAGMFGSDAGAAGGTGFNGAAGGDAGSAGALGGAGGGGAGGGQGGAGTNPGGAGGTVGVPNGGDGISAAVGSGGGGGFHGNGFTGTLPGGNLVGGDGGRGGDSSQDGFGAAGGGAGGYGALLTTSGSFNNSSSVTGGSGGAGGTYTGVFGQATDGNGGAGGIGMLLGAGSTLTNSGTIAGGNGGAGATQGVGGDGVVGDNLTVINTSTGTISAGSGSGTPNAIRIDTGDLSLNNAGAINGSVTSVLGAITATNSGAILSGAVAMSAATGLDLTNTATGTITGSVTSSSGLALINNVGTINGGASNAISADSLTLINSGSIVVDTSGLNTAIGAISDANITNTAGALISAGSYGLVLFGSSVVSNAGTITAGRAAIFGGDNLTVINEASGVIAGGEYGIQACGCSLLTLVNAGSITGTSTAAISASTIDISNTGTISSTNGAGIETANGGTVTNAAGGTISGFTYGINASNGSITVLNSGAITADRTNFGSRAITASGDLTLVNDANGTINGNEGVRSEASLNVTNAGTIDAQGYAIRAQFGGSSITNAGTIGGGGDGGTTAILFSGGNNTLTLAPGSSITGLVLANNSNDTFQLGGSAGAATFNAAQVGPGQQYQGFNNFIKTDGSTWTLTGTPGQATSWTINGGTLSVSANSNLGNANEAVTFNGGVLQITGTAFTSTPRTLNWGASGGGFDIADASNTFTIGQAIGPGGPLQKLGAGTLLLTGANTYTGGTTISAGTLQLGDGVTNGSILGNVTNNGTLAFFTATGTTRTFGGTISGIGGVSTVDDFAGSGTTVLTAANTYSGGTTLRSGILSVATDANLGAAGGGVMLANGALQVANGFSSARIISLQNGGGGSVQVDSGTATLTGAINTTGPAGFGSFTKDGNGTLVLSGTMSGRVGVAITGGTLQIGSATAINTTSSVNLSAGTTFDLAGNSISIAALLGSGGLITNSRPATAILNTFNDQPFGFVLSSDIQDGVGRIGLTTGGNSLRLGGNNTYSGASVFNSQVNAGSSTAFSANSAYTVNGALNINGNTVTIGSLAGNGGVGNLANTSGRLTTGSDNTSTTFVGSLDNSGAAWELVKVGSGTFTIAGTDNQFTGATTVAGGNLRVNGALLGDVTVLSGGTLSGIGSIGGAVTVQSGGTLSAGQSPGTITLGTLNLNAGSISQFELGAPGIAGGASNDLVNVTGNLTLGGTLNVNAPSAGYYRLFNYGTLTPGSSFAAITGSTQGTPTVLTNLPNQINLSVRAVGQNLQFWDGADMTGNGVVNGGAGIWNASNTNWTGAPGQAGVNDQWRSSVGVFAGAVAGPVTVVGTQAFDTLQFSTNGYVLNPGAGGQLQLAAVGGAAATLNTDANVTATINTPLVNGGSQGLSKVGAGTLILTAANTYTGDTTINAGTLQLGNGGTTGSIVGNIVDNATLALNRSDSVTFGGVISGSGAVNQIGTGTTTLTGANTYTGGTTISGGTLQIGNGGTVGSITGNVVNNATLAFNRSDVVAFGGVVSGAGAVNQIGSGTTILTANNTYGGNTTISAGTLQIGNGSTTGSIAGNVVDNGVLVFNRSNAIRFDGAISGTGVVQQNGTGITILTAATTYIGGTTINAGALQLGNGGATGSIAGNVVNNATLAFNRSDAVTFGGVISGSGGVQQLGAGATTLTAANTYTGGTTINAGTLVIAAGGSITSNVANNATFNNSGTVTGTLVSTATAVNNAVITGAVTNSGSFANATGATLGGRLTNNAGTASNAGTLDGGLANGGTFTNLGATNGGLTNTGSVNANGGAINGAIANNAGTFNVGGTVTSNSTFGNANGATLAISGAGNYTIGGWLSNSGALTVASGGQLTATAGGITNTATGTITNNGTLRDDLNNAGVVTNNGAYVATVATNTGTITNAATGIWTGNVASSTGTIVNNGVWAGNIVSSGTLTGAGSVANLSVTGGTFAPGNGAAGSSMTVTGSLTLTAAATYLVQINPTTASFANVAGSATLGGATVNAVYANGSYVSRRYAILSTGSRSGTFNALVNTNLPTNFSSSLSYDATNAYLDLKLNFSVPGGLNQNQQNVANALTNFFTTTGGIPLAFAALSPAGLTLASGELGVGTQQATFDAMNLFMGLLTDPFVAGRGESALSPGGPSAFADEALSYAPNGKRPATASEREAYAAIYRKAPPLAAPSFEQRWSVWSAGYGGSQTTDGNAALGSNTTTSRVAAGVVGLDYRISPNTLVGIALAGGGTGYSLAGGLGSGRSDLFQAGAYLRHTIGASYLTAALAYGWQDVTTERVVGADRLNARFTTDTVSGRVEGGHRFATPWLGGMGITPYAAGQFTTISLPTYAETPGVTNTFGLSYAAKDVTASRSELGLRSDKSFIVQDGLLTLRGRAAWAHNFNPDRSIAATFQSLPGASFVVNGAAQARDAALVTASAEMKWRTNWSVAATFEGEVSNVTSSYAGKGVVRYAW